MGLLQRIKRLIHAQPVEVFSLIDTFGCSETPPQSCPTFIEREAHKRFQSAIMAHNIIVVYGESRQGKTWTIDKYCPKKYRIGCNAAMDIDQIKKEMLRALGITVHLVEHSIRQQSTQGVTTTTEIGSELLARAGASVEAGKLHEETLTASYPTIDFAIDSDFLNVLSEKSQDGYFVFDNFHYLSIETQKQFCSLLKEFNYRGIKVIIVGVWKEASRITALASDLVDRCEHIDIGSWSDEELRDVVQKGQKALNIGIESAIVEAFINCSAHNVGIFKTYLRKYCDKLGVFETLEKHKILCDETVAKKAIEEVVSEAMIPLFDRVRNLSTPKRERSDGKRMRQKIVCATINLIVGNNSYYAQSGIPFEDLFNELNNICNGLNESPFERSNVTQELLQLHLREENRDVKENMIPLFFYDKANRKLLVIDPGFYQIKAFNEKYLQNLSEELISPPTDQIRFETSCTT